MPSKKQVRKERLNKKKRNIIILVVLVLTISIGFALLSTTSYISGTSTIKNSTWNVHFDNIDEQDGSVTPDVEARITDEDKLNITYTITLDKPGDYYEFTVDVVNDGSIDAKLKQLPTITGVSQEQDVYINYTFTHSDGSAIEAGEIIESGDSTNFRVRVEYDPTITSDSQLPKTDQTLDLDVEMYYEQV